MPDKKNKTVLLHFRATPDDDALFKKAAELDERKVGDWMRNRLKRIAVKECGKSSVTKKESAS